MRLRQAHAIFEAATALEAAGLGFELWPLHHDVPGTAPHITRDMMNGFAEFTDPDTPGRQARIYNIDIMPGPDDDTIEASLTYGGGPDPQSLLYSKYSVAMNVQEAERFRALVGAQLAERVVEEVLKHERPFRSTYEERSGKPWTQV
ncbi:MULTISPECIES: hypothetical protein [unclassified Streptomyces]|uniref:hypothetical protein n=1 Tax=unclassified Streptomyces TaxID=2593676 RepID=UPI00278C034F|nr:MULTISPECIES: hypothetical protein [unclassified Streptomyces]